MQHHSASWQLVVASPSCHFSGNFMRETKSSTEKKGWHPAMGCITCAGPCSVLSTAWCTASSNCGMTLRSSAAAIARQPTNKRHGAQGKKQEVCILV